jgi:SnoaL-like domain
MSAHTSVSAAEGADRLAIRELVDAYARLADRRLPKEQADLYADEARSLVYMGDASEPVQVLVGREQHVEGFSGLSQYAATTHLNGQFTIDLDGDTATGEGYCLAHHILEGEQGRFLTVMSIRYEDTYTKQNGDWLFAERKLIITWTDTRPSQP